MIDGTYNIKIDVPFGRKEGTIALHTENGVLFADIDAPVVGKQHMEAQAEGDTFTAQGSGKIKFLGQVEYTLKGVVSGDNLHVDIQSNKGELKLDGIRV